MKNNGAIRKVMFIVLLSILGSYCIGSDQQDCMSEQTNYDGKSGSSVKNKVPKVKKISTSKNKASQAAPQKALKEKQKKKVIKVTTKEQKVASKQKTSQALKLVPSEIEAKKVPFIENVAEYNQVHGNDNACTDGRDDCVYDEHFFNDTWFTGKLDQDPTTHLDPDTRPMILIDDLATGA